MNNFDYTNLTTRELLEKALNGEIPIPRNNPQLGQSKYFFMKTGADPYASINDADVFDVPDGTDPFAFRDNGYQMPVATSTESALLKNAWGTDTLSSNSLTSGIKDTYLTALAPLQQNTNSYLSTLNNFSQSNDSTFGIGPNESVMDYLRRLFPLESANSSSSPTDLMTSTLSTPLHQEVQNGLNAVFGSTPSYAGTINTERPLDITADVNRHLDALKTFEGSYDRIYFDKPGNSTIGIGKLIDEYQIRNNLIFNLNKEQQDDLINTIKIVSPYFHPDTGVFRNWSADAQIKMFQSLAAGNNIKDASKGDLSSLPEETQNAFRKIYNYSIPIEKQQDLTNNHYEKFVKSQINKLLDQNGLKWNDLSEGERDVILDLGYNPGKVPINQWSKFNEALKQRNLYKAAVETHRIGVSPERNNFNLLRIMPEYNHLHPSILNKKLKKFKELYGNIELTKDNFDLYQSIFGVSTNPFRLDLIQP